MPYWFAMLDYRYLLSGWLAVFEHSYQAFCLDRGKNPFNFEEPLFSISNPFNIASSGRMASNRRALATKEIFAINRADVFSYPTILWTCREVDSRGSFCI